MIQDHYLLVQRWRPFFLQDAEVSSKVVVWLKIPKLPLELYNANCLKRIGSALGTLLKLDRATSIHSRGKFARMCVEVDLSQPLISHLLIRGHQLQIEYEGLHLICFSCGCYGHRADQCQGSQSSMKEKDPTAAAVQGDSVAEEVHGILMGATGDISQDNSTSGNAASVAKEGAIQVVQDATIKDSG